MAADPRLEDLDGAVVVYRDSHGARARFRVERVTHTRAVCRYVVEGQLPPVRCHEGEPVNLGLRAENGWIVATGEVVEVHRTGSISVEVNHLSLTQRRAAYRQKLGMPVGVRLEGSDAATWGWIENLSVGGFAARLRGFMAADDAPVVVELPVEDEESIVARARKVGGDLPQRFRFTALDRVTEARIVQIVRTAELASRNEDEEEPPKHRWRHH